MIPFQSQIIAAAVIAALAFGAGWKVNSWRWDAADKARIEAEHEAFEKASERINKASEDFENIAANLSKARPVVEREVRREIQLPIYRDCLVPASGVQLYNRAGEQPAAVGEPEKVMLGTGQPAGKREHGGLARRGGGE